MKRILIVEDEQDIQELLEAYLGDAGYETATAGDGIEAVSLFQQEAFDLVLLDVMLPKLDGFGVCELIRRQSRVPIVLLTALDGEAEQLRGFDLEIDDYITKPFSMPILLRKLAAVLRRAGGDAPGRCLRYRGLTLDPDAVEVRLDGRVLEQLTAREFELLRELLLGLHSMCRGAESVYFNGRTNITSARFLVFGVKDLIHANSSVKDALLFNLLSYLSDQLLTKGNTVAALDELYLWLSNLTTIEYIRNCLKRVRKRNSALILASQNLEDFDIQGVRELTRPLFAIPTHQFLFHGGKVDKKFYMDNLQLESAEYDLISSPNNGVCLFKSGADRNLLDVHAPPHKHALITGGGG